MTVLDKQVVAPVLPDAAETVPVDRHEVETMTVVEPGTVTTLCEVDVETTSVVIVANSVEIGVTRHWSAIAEGLMRSRKARALGNQIDGEGEQGARSEGWTLGCAARGVASALGGSQE